MSYLPSPFLVGQCVTICLCSQATPTIIINCGVYSRKYDMCWCACTHVQVNIELCTLSLSISVSILFPDPSLTPENLATVLDCMDMYDDALWRFCDYVNMPRSEKEKIKLQYSSKRKHKEGIIFHVISTHPSLSWNLVANALYQMGPLCGDCCHRALDRLQQLFPTGNVCKQEHIEPQSGEGACNSAYYTY